jgi:fatty-acyl-CoA synthase
MTAARVPPPDDRSLMGNIAEHLRARAADGERTALAFEDDTWTWAEYLDACATRAAYLRAHLPDGAPRHVGVLLDNVPEFVMWLGAAALVDAVVVGINPTRRGEELARDITHTDCRLVVTEQRHRALLDGLDLGDASGAVLVVDDPGFAAALAPYAGAALPDDAVDETATYMLLFTSGTSGAPKACVLSQGRLERSSAGLTLMQQLTADDVMYCVMPLFHSNCIITSFAPWLISGATLVLRRRFSASGFLPDVRRYGVTYFNYVGKPLSYILATPEQADDADNTLTRVFGNEGADLDIERFGRRFGCVVGDGYGSTEGGANIGRTPDMPKGALGVAAEGTVIIDADTGEEAPRARFDDQGHLLNPDEAIGEIVNKEGAPLFEGYYKNDAANEARVRDGWYWTGDLGYRDEAGFFYFAGRDFEWLRVDGENFAAAPVERILARHPDVVLAAVYAVPDEEVGDQVMAALELRPGSAFDPGAFDAFLDEQSDLGTKWSPRYVRVTEALPVTETQKVLKRVLRRDRWDVSDPVYWRASKREQLRPMSDDDRAALRTRFETRGRLDQLERV